MATAAVATRRAALSWQASVFPELRNGPVKPMRVLFTPRLLEALIGSVYLVTVVDRLVGM